MTIIPKHNVLPLYNVSLAGKYGAGKSTIFEYLKGHLGIPGGSHGVADYEYTVANFPSKIKLHDTAGMERHSITMGNYYRHCACIVFVYDVTDVMTLDYCRKEHQLIMDKGYCDANTKFVLLRNKIDVHESQVSVSKDYAMQFVHDNVAFGNSLFHVGETSAVDGTGIVQFFTIDLINLLSGVDPVQAKEGLFDGYYDNKNDSCCY